MKRPVSVPGSMQARALQAWSFFLSPVPRVLLGIATVGAVAVIGCNTAQISQAANVDAGPACSTLKPIATCDGGSKSPNACAGGVTLSPDVGENVDASAIVPPGSYDPSCTVAFWVQDVASPDCLPTEPCACIDGGATSPGVWSCTSAQ
jgi:hypothetical protein